MQLAAARPPLTPPPPTQPHPPPHPPTPQALLANIAALYGVYHGPKGLTEIADRVHGLAATAAAGAKKLGLKVGAAPFFDTVAIGVPSADKVLATGLKHQVRGGVGCRFFLGGVGGAGSAGWGWVGGSEHGGRGAEKRKGICSVVR